VEIDWEAENRERLEALKPFLKDLADMRAEELKHWESLLAGLKPEP
jgi:hypothetical protein